MVPVFVAVGGMWRCALEYHYSRVRLVSLYQLDVGKWELYGLPPVCSPLFRGGELIFFYWFSAVTRMWVFGRQEPMALLPGFN